MPVALSDLKARAEEVDSRIWWGAALTAVVGAAGYGAYRWMSRRRAAAPGLNALELLRQDHEKVKDLFERFDKNTNPAAKRSIVDEVIAELEVHEKIEEELFYPAVRRASGDEPGVDRALAEHQHADGLIAELQLMEPTDPGFEEKFHDLAQRVRQHIYEEESELFPEAKRSQIDLARLGQQMAERRKSLKSQLLRPEMVL